LNYVVGIDMEAGGKLMPLLEEVFKFERMKETHQKE